MAITQQADIQGTVQTQWDKKLLTDMLLAASYEYLTIAKDARTESMGRGNGDTKRFSRILRQSKQTTNYTPGTIQSIDNSAVKKFTSNYKDITNVFLSDIFGIDEEVDIISFLGNEDYRRVVALQIAQSHDYILQKLMATGLIQMRVDMNATNYVNGTLTGVGSGTVSDTARGEADDYWNGSTIAFWDSTKSCYDESGVVTDFVGATGTFTVALTNTAVVGQRYVISNRKDLGASSMLTTAALMRCTAWLKALYAAKFPGGTYRGLISPQQEIDLHKDPDWKAYVQYDRSNVVERYTPLQWFDVQLLVGTEIYRTDTDGTENQASGDVHHALVYGQEAFAIEAWGDKGEGFFNTQVYMLDQPDKYDTRNARKGLLWKDVYGTGILGATRGVALLTGASNDVPFGASA